MTIDLERAKKTPSVVFAGPHEVVERDDIVKADKIEILLRWRHDALQLETAQGENMQADEDTQLRDVLNALRRLGHHPDHEQ